MSPIIVWFRRDLRLADNLALSTACKSGRPVVAVFIDDETPQLRRPGGAAKWWLDKSLRALAADIGKLGGRLILRHGSASSVLSILAEETGADSIVWNRLYDPWTVARDRSLKAALEAQGINCKSYNLAMINEPWDLLNGSAAPYKVFSPYWRAARGYV